MNKRLIAAFVCTSLLSACGGGGGSSTIGTNSSNPNSGSGTGSTTQTTLDQVTNSAIAQVGTGNGNPQLEALRTGSVKGLNATDRAAFLSLATQLSTRYQQQQNGAITDIYGDASLNLTLNHTSNSSEINVSSRTVATPLLLADDGSGMAAIAQYGKGRGLAYGADVLSWIANQSRETQHTALFTRAFNWVLTGKAAGPLPSTIKFATTGYATANVSKFISNQGKVAQAVACDLSVNTNTCWQNADLLVFGSGTTYSAELAAQVRKYLDSGKAVIYMHPSWIDSAGGRQVLAGMGMSLGGYPGNYYASAAGVSIGATRTVAENLAKSDQMSKLVQTLNLLAQDKPQLALSQDASVANPITQIHNELAAMQGNGINIFNDATTDLYRLLVLWADLYRPEIQYGKINRDTAPGDFLRTYASDSWLAFNRSDTTVSATGQGDFMPAVAQSLPVSSNAETIEVTIPQSGGITAIGRGAVPGKPVYIEVVNAGGASALKVQTNYLRAWGNPLTDKVSDGYKRPRRPQSFSIPLASGENVFVTPFGGPLYLNYSGATAGQNVTLKIRGAAKYAHFDFTKPQNQAEIDEAVAAMQRRDFGWQTAKLVGGEIQQTIGFANSAMGNKTPEQYVVGEIKEMLFDSNHIANGFNNMPLSSNVANLCTQFGWDCTGPIHRARSVQHFVGWIAACGYLCSGNPSDGFAAISGTGWGHSHELGHNTVQRVMHIEFNGKGCVVECDNNILASMHMMRQYKLLGIDTGHATDHPGLYQDIIANRNSGLSGNAKIVDMQTRLWDMANGQDPMRAAHFQIAFLFGKYRLNEAKPSMESTLDYFTLLTKADRMVAQGWDANNKAKYGMSRFADNKISNPDLLYVLSSKIIGRDLRSIFAMYGISVSQTALDSIADLNLPLAAEQFYALATGKHNQPSTGVWLDLAATTPSYPF
ncbi:ImpA family metalloprotease [Chitinibacter sp. SCUT-21]|uniref:ImpA family metalloprotease n=1 Tax=Chitinibacter sp. SCUT-21 TaxID=2970891 RepID=UPI0035A5B84F